MTKQIVFACAALIFAGCSTPPSASPTANDIGRKVTLTRNAADIKGMTRVGDVSASAYMVFGSPEMLLKQASAKIKKETAAQGGTTVLIQKDDFKSTPINNVNLLGVAYK